MFRWIAKAAARRRENKGKGGSSGNNSGHYVTTYTYQPKCCHDAKTPIKVGDFDLWLGAERDIEYGVLRQMDILLPLNGYLPKGAVFGGGMHVIFCGMQDRGGVPKGWRSFLGGVVELLPKYKCLAYCTGSHGRTGTFAASLISLVEPATEDPIAAIRERHCDEAVESLEQAKGIFDLRGVPLPERYAKEFGRSFRYIASGNRTYSRGPTQMWNGQAWEDILEDAPIANGNPHHPCICASAGRKYCKAQEHGPGPKRQAPPYPPKNHDVSCACKVCEAYWSFREQHARSLESSEVYGYWEDYAAWRS